VVYNGCWRRRGGGGGGKRVGSVAEVNNNPGRNCSQLATRNQQKRVMTANEVARFQLGWGHNSNESSLGPLCVCIDIY
jgi:hypothetical protein